MRLLVPVLMMIVVAACDARLPTEPRASAPHTDAPVVMTALPCPTAATTEPPMIVMAPGTSRDVTVRLCYIDATVLPFAINVGPPDIASGHATIDVGRNSTVVRVTALKAGVASVTYTVGNFGRAPSSGLAGVVRVAESSRRRAVR